MKFKLPRTNFLDIFQLRNFVKKQYGSFPNMSQATPVENSLKNKVIIPYIYGLISESSACLSHWRSLKVNGNRTSFLEVLLFYDCPAITVKLNYARFSVISPYMWQILSFSW